jgi:hypothetical protein
MRSPRSSSERCTRETSETATIAPTNKSAIVRPSGLSTMFATGAYAKTSATGPNTKDAPDGPCAGWLSIVTAMDPGVILARTPVA